jgi:hypothetical protein
MNAYCIHIAHKKFFDALNRTLKDFRENDRPMGRAILLLADNFPQTLPEIPRSTPLNKLNVCL